MVISREISADIMKYLQEKEGQSVNDIAESMSTSPEFIQFVIEGKFSLTPDHVNNYTKKKNIRFWEFAIKAIPMSHLSEKARKKVQLCKELSECLEKKLKK